MTIGPVIEDGFYYDFAYKRPFSSDDLAAIEKRMAEIAAEDLPVRRRVIAAGCRGRAFQENRRALQGGDHRGDPVERTDQSVRAGRLGRLVPRPARAQHREAQSVQADEGGRRVLARRFAQRNAAADLWHRLGQREAAQGISHPPRRGRETGSPAHRQGTRPVPLAGGGAGRGVLASEGLDAVSAAYRLHARTSERRGLHGSQYSRNHGPRTLGEVRSRRDVRREHVHDPDAGRATCSRSSR